MSGRPVEIEDPSNLWFVHRVSDAMMPVALAWKISPNIVSLLGLACGLAAGFFYAHAPSLIACLAGFVCMIFWHVFDGLDGKLARATGQTSPLGRVLDGLCDHGTFLAVYIGLGLSISAQGISHWGLVALSALAHAVQSNFYEARRQAYIARLSGQRALRPFPDQIESLCDQSDRERMVCTFKIDPSSLDTAPQNGADLIEEGSNSKGSKTGFGGEALYDRVQYASLKWTCATDEMLGTPAALSAYKHHAEPILKRWCLLGANLRTLMIFIFCLSPFGATAYLIWEVFILTLVMLVLEFQLRQAEQKFRQA
jgi:phosphatidylglycerophosphate synthase